MAIGVIATVKVQAGKEADFEAVFKDLAAKVRANEPGNKLYQLCRSKADPTTYIAMELYEDAAALDTHGKTEYFQAASAKLGSVVTGPPDIQLFDTV